MSYVAIDNINDLQLPPRFSGERLNYDVESFLGGHNFPSTFVLDSQKARVCIAAIPSMDEYLNQGYGEVNPGYGAQPQYAEMQAEIQPAMLCYLQLVPSRNNLAEGEYTLLVQVPIPGEYQDAERTIPMTVTTSEIPVRLEQEISTMQMHSDGMAVIHHIGVIQDIVWPEEPNALPQVIINFYTQETAPEYITLEAA